MNFVSALAMALGGVEVRRKSWRHDAPEMGEARLDQRLVLRDGGLAFEGEDYVYGRTRSFGKRLILGSDDLTADDWEIAAPPPAGVTEPVVAWQPISTAPKDGTEVDLWEDGCRYPDCHWHRGEWLYWASAGVDDEPHHERVANPTHWMRAAPPSAPNVEG